MKKLIWLWQRTTKEWVSVYLIVDGFWQSPITTKTNSEQVILHSGKRKNYTFDTHIKMNTELHKSSVSNFPPIDIKLSE